MLDNAKRKGVMMKDKFSAFISKIRDTILAKYWTFRLWWWFQDHEAQDFEDALIDLGFVIIRAGGDRNSYERVYKKGEAQFTVTVEKR